MLVLRLDGDPDSIGIGVSGEDNLGIFFLSERDSEVEGGRFFGVRGVECGESRVIGSLWGDEVDILELGFF